MAGLMRPDKLRDRIMIWAEEEMRAGALPPRSDIVLKAALYQGVLQPPCWHIAMPSGEGGNHPICRAGRHR